MATPQINEQHEIVRPVESLFAFADRLEARLAAAQTAAEQLPPALLAKAFRGELVPQDPADEPASELLKRLAASRASTAQPKRSRTPRQPACPHLLPHRCRPIWARPAVRPANQYQSGLQRYYSTKTTFHKPTF